MKDTAYTYMVECADGSLYTGWTNQLVKRIRCHNEGKGARYTRARLPVRLVYYEVFDRKQDAMKQEYAIKQLTRKDKLLLIAQMPEDVRQECDHVMRQIEQSGCMVKRMD